MNLKTLILFVLFAQSMMVMTGQALADVKKPLAWQIKNPTWTKSFESSYEEFIATLGKAKSAGHCKTTDSCLKNPLANPRYYHLNPSNLRNVTADCADLPYILRAYFSWMNDLPFSYPTKLSAVGGSSFLSEDKAFESDEEQPLMGELSLMRWGWGRGGRGRGDIRYNRYGNKIDEKKYVKNGDNINTVLEGVLGAISTATFRTNANNNSTSTLFRDTYPVSISKSTIKAGTILYDPNGHVAVVYEVSDIGKIHLIDAHPDNSLTSITYGEKFSRTSVEVGGGFSNWRPFSYENGVVAATPNEALAGFSLLQFQKDNKFIFNNISMNFYEYVRNQLSNGALIYSPVAEVTELLEEVCHDMKEREISVTASLSQGLQNKEHPSKLPDNIYGTDGEWETYSTPSRDARLKASIREGRNLILKMIEGYRNGDSSIRYDGVDLVGDLKSAYAASTEKCELKIKKTNGSIVAQNLDAILTNIYKLSFDPYHCAELRWGLTDPESLQSCGQSKNKLDWYKAEQGLRNSIDRNYSLKMDYDLTTLPGAAISNVQQQNISLKDVLDLY
jgi:hypothetical protein